MKKLITLLFVSIVVMPAMAQKIKLVEGDLSALKGQKSIAVEYSYDNMTIGGKGKTEREYVDEKTKKINEKEPGKGDEWAKAWVADRKDRYEPRFNQMFTENSALSLNASATYTLVFHTTRTEPGFNVGVTKQNAYIDAEVTILDASKKVIAKLTVLKSPGRLAFGMDFDTGVRIQEAYAKAGKEVGQLLAKKLK